jgi:hypothetical protein
MSPKEKAKKARIKHGTETQERARKASRENHGNG